eukprot:gnl/MRDRNA2_/MRDRNA2_75836_c0_seq1.p1 gnl/MRDRNA2_/MRDRNA2_75836_c0~~gnl/MRDRNA2_/MRDRNA2_75836_c0_seq1.p1  ORF type:complete len:220 (-),score=33.65 gnl/MRDRNA2_/MRDRNA2_75836_c0_seq1:227-886(-)
MWRHDKVGRRESANLVGACTPTCTLACKAWLFFVMLSFPLAVQVSASRSAEDMEVSKQNVILHVQVEDRGIPTQVATQAQHGQHEMATKLTTNGQAKSKEKRKEVRSHGNKADAARSLLPYSSLVEAWNQINVSNEEPPHGQKTMSSEHEKSTSAVEPGQAQQAQQEGAESVAPSHGKEQHKTELHGPGPTSFILAVVCTCTMVVICLCVLPGALLRHR